MVVTGAGQTTSIDGSTATITITGGGGGGDVSGTTTARLNNLDASTASITSEYRNIVSSNIKDGTIVAADVAASVFLSSDTTGVTEGAYTNTNLTVDKNGRIRLAANGTGGGGGGAIVVQQGAGSYSGVISSMTALKDVVFDIRSGSVNVSVDLSTLVARANNLDNSTATLTTRLNNLDGSTAAMTTRLGNLDSSTASIQAQVLLLSTSSLSGGGGGVKSLYLRSTFDTSNSSSYFLMQTTPATTAEVTKTAAVSAASGLVMLSSHSTLAGGMGASVVTLPTGFWQFVLYAGIDSIVNQTDLICNLSTMSKTGTNKFQFLAGTVTNVNTLTPSQFVAETVLTSDVSISTDDRVVLDIYAKTSSALSRTVTLALEGTARVSRIGTTVERQPTFLALNDTPVSYNGKSGQFPQVNPGETALIFNTIDTMTAINRANTIANSTGIVVNGTLISSMVFTGSGFGGAAYNGATVTLTFSGGGAGGGDNLGTHIATQVLSMNGFGIMGSSGIIIGTIQPTLTALIFVSTGTGYTGSLIAAATGTTNIFDVRADSFTVFSSSPLFSSLYKPIAVTVNSTTSMRFPLTVVGNNTASDNPGIWNNGAGFTPALYVMRNTHAIIDLRDTFSGSLVEMFMQADATLAQFGTFTNHGLSFYTNNTVRGSIGASGGLTMKTTDFVLKADGSGVAIGTTTPKAMIHLQISTGGALDQRGIIIATGPSTIFEFNITSMTMNIATTSINSVVYQWPSAQGGSNQVLSNNGSGVLSWVAQTGVGGGGGALTVQNSSGSTTYTAISSLSVLDPLSLDIKTSSANLSLIPPKCSWPINSSAWAATVTSGAATSISSETASPTNRLNFDQLQFKNNTTSYIYQQLWTPKGYNSSTFTYQYSWTATSGTVGQTSTFTVDCSILGNGDALDTAYGTAIGVNSDLKGIGQLHISSESAPMTCSGTPGPNKMMFLRMRRLGSDGLAAFNQLIGMTLYYTRNKFSE